MANERETLNLISGGAGRGARATLPAATEWSEKSERTVIRPIYVDPVPGKARQLQMQAVDSGLDAEAYEMKIEEALTGEMAPNTAVVLQLDQPAAVEHALLVSVEYPVPVFAYSMVRTQRDQLLGLALALAAEERDLKKRAAELFKSLAALTVRSGAGAIFGDDGRVQHRQAEAVYRRLCSRHLLRNLPKLIAGLPPESNPIEATWDGQTWQGLVIRPVAGWQQPVELARQVASDPDIPLIPGQEYTVAELGSDGIRLHRIRMRRLDGRMTVNGTAALDEAVAAEQAERLRREAETAMQRANRQAITRTQPIWFSE